MASVAWLVEAYTVDGQRIKFQPGYWAEKRVWSDIVWFEESYDEREVRTSLINHDGYPVEISVTPNY